MSHRSSSAVIQERASNRARSTGTENRRSVFCRRRLKYDSKYDRTSARTLAKRGSR